MARAVPASCRRLFTGLVLLAECLGFAAASLAADTATHSAPSQGQGFRLTHLTYDTNGLIVAPKVHRDLVQTFSYGGLITNLTFRTELPPRDPMPPPEPATSGPPIPQTSENAPPRPSSMGFSLDWWRREQGMPENKVNCLIQTRDGYLWAGTPEGLARFDGARFTIFNGANTPLMLSEGTMPQAFFEDADGRLWIATERGVLLYENRRFVEFPGQADLRRGRFSCIIGRSAGGLWLASEQGLFHYADGKVVHYPEIADGFTTPSGDLFEENPDSVWCGNFSGLYRFDPTTRQAAPLVKCTGWNKWRFLRDRYGRVWIGSADGVRQWADGIISEFHTETQRLKSGLPAVNNPFLVADNDGRVWAFSRTRGAGLCFHPKSGAVEEVNLGNQDEIGLSLTADREGLLWIGTWHSGIARLEPQSFSTFSLRPLSESRNIRTITEGRDGSIWAGALGGIIRWSGYEICFFDLRNDLQIAHGVSVYAVPSGRVWGALPFGGIMQMPVDDRDPWMQLAGSVRHAAAGSVRVMYRTSDKKLWLGTTNGLRRIIGDQSFDTLRIPQIAHDEVRVLSEDRKGKLWVGSKGGLDCLPHVFIGLAGQHWVDSKGGPDYLAKESPRRWTVNEGLPSDEVEALHFDRDGDLWVGTEGGLCRIRGGEVFVFGPDSGLPQHSIQQVLEDESNRLWLHHKTGISCVFRTELNEWAVRSGNPPAISLYGRSDGLLNPELVGQVQHPSGIRAGDGRMWFATRGGLAVMDPSEVASLPRPIALVEQFTAGGKVLQGDGLTNSWNSSLPPIRLPPAAGADVSFRYTTTSLRRRDQVQIRFRLEGQDADWREGTAEGAVHYANLKPGAYRFRVRAAVRNGVWSEKDAEVAFIQPPLFWRTWSFLTVCGILTASAIGGASVWGLHRQRRKLQQEQEHALDAERMRIARDMHDQLGSKLSSIALATGKGTEAQSQVREAVQELNALVWSVNPANGTLSGLADFVSNFAQQYLDAAGMALDLDIPGALPDRELPSTTRSELAAVFKEALRNVVQHSGAKQVRVSLRVHPSRLVLEVADDGRGFDPASLGARQTGPTGGGGLGNLRRRLERLGGECRIDSAPGRGTCIEFRVPLSFKAS